MNDTFQQRRPVKFRFEDGAAVVKTMDGTRADIQAFCIGHAFRWTAEEDQGRDTAAKVVGVEFLS